MSKFKIGDIVRCSPETWMEAENLKQKLVVTDITINHVWVHCSNDIGFNKIPWDFEDFVLCEETVVDRILTKYSNG